MADSASSHAQRLFIQRHKGFKHGACAPTPTKGYARQELQGVSVAEICLLQIRWKLVEYPETLALSKSPSLYQFLHLLR